MDEDQYIPDVGPLPVSVPEACWLVGLPTYKRGSFRATSVYNLQSTTAEKVSLFEVIAYENGKQL